MRLRTRLAGIATCLGLFLSGCTAGDDAGDVAGTVSPGTTRPAAALTLIADTDPGAAAISASRALYETSPVVVLAAADNLAGLTLGASAAVALGVPLLLTGSARTPTMTTSSPTTEPTAVTDSDPTEAGAPSAGDGLAGEFERLDASSVLAVGTSATQGVPENSDLQIIEVAADSGAVSAAIGMDLGPGEPVAPGDLAVAVADLDSADPVALLPAGGSPEDAEDQAGADDVTLPVVRRPEPLTGTLVLATATPESLAGIATARAAGVAVQVVTPDQVDPRSSDAAIAALSLARPRAVIALGAGYADQRGLDWKLTTAATGEQFPGGGQLLFQQRMFVALYGYTTGGALGVLGEQDAAGAVQRAIQTASEYDALVSSRIVPAFEIIATVASEFAGPDGNYSTESSIEQLQPWVDAAGAAGIYVLLDLQPGRTDFLTQAQLYEPLLRLPHVGLALDPEWRLLPNQVHLRQIGSVTIEEVNAVATWLADLTRAHALPQKLLLLHQFLPEMIQNRDLLDTSRDELAFLIHVDGYGSPADKLATWESIRDGAPANVYWGWKNFIDEDLPLLTPEQTIAQAVPTPQLITYQ